MLDDFTVVALNTVAFDETSDFYEQLVMSKGKVQIVVSACIQTLNTVVLGSSNAANQQDWNFFSSWVFFEAAAQFESVNDRHDNVANNEIWLDGDSESQALFAIDGEGNVVALLIKEVY